MAELADARDFWMLYDGFKIFGPYLGSDGRLRIKLSKDGVHKQMSYPKFVVEQNLDRQLTVDEIIHHRDENPLNNKLSNLEIMSRQAHAQYHLTSKDVSEFICPWCKKHFTLQGKKLKNSEDNRRKGKHGPFCSRSCAGKWSTQ